MEFQLEQLSADNLTMLFANAYYNAETVDLSGDAETQDASTIVTTEDTKITVQARKQDFSLVYKARFLHEKTSSKLRDLLIASNAINGSPVQAQVLEAKGGWYFDYAYRHIVPDGGSIDTKEIIGIFRLFEKLIGQHRCQIALSSKRSKSNHTG